MKLLRLVGFMRLCEFYESTIAMTMIICWCTESRTIFTQLLITNFFFVIARVLTFVYIACHVWTPSPVDLARSLWAQLPLKTFLVVVNGMLIAMIVNITLVVLTTIILRIVNCSTQAPNYRLYKVGKSVYIHSTTLQFAGRGFRMRSLRSPRLRVCAIIGIGKWSKSVVNASGTSMGISKGVKPLLTNTP